MATPLNHRREYLALCASQLPTASLQDPAKAILQASPYLTLKPRTLAQARQDTGRVFDGATFADNTDTFPGEHGRGQF